MHQQENKTERVHLRMTPASRKKLESLARKSKTTLSATVENLIYNVPIREMPPLDFYKLCEEMRAIGRNFNQLVRLAHLTGNVNHPKYAQQAAEIQKAILEVWNTILHS